MKDANRYESALTCLQEVAQELVAREDQTDELTDMLKQCLQLLSRQQPRQVAQENLIESIRHLLAKYGDGCSHKGGWYTNHEKVECKYCHESFTVKEWHELHHPVGAT